MRIVKFEKTSVWKTNNIKQFEKKRNLTQYVLKIIQREIGIVFAPKILLSRVV
ncbi:hypothetical protein T15_1208 [Streptococcus suis T15]|nr:hypothetical protein T15_1208 [Streptococcus suis T15]QBX21143.1 hypothetical protein Javan563_0024 [Streptococcus phage Javan563]QBX21264.1 hypothetical protein Javan567_0024 [Streptococcus phage Javan567]QBX21319.1 hypothetical protein Javan569_0024 [Streptococcus phage Javan569]QBX31016.1 hypothetical protein Javan590_0024 [Streptococcus phage Javan590]